MKAFFVALLFLFPVASFAYQPIFVEPVSSDDRIVITEPERERTYFGVLNDFPHTYELVVTEPVTLRAEILAPDIETVQSNLSGMIVSVPKRGGLEMVAQMGYSTAAWETSYDASTGDAYRHGGLFEGELEPGTYYIEVSTVDNVGKYVLIIGQGEKLSHSGYFKTLSNVFKIKNFFEKPLFAVLQSPFYYIPTLVFLLLGLFLYWRYHRSNGS